MPASDRTRNTTDATATTSRSKWLGVLKLSFGIDLRTLALVRVCLGTLIVADLLLRTRNFRAHYTDAGVLPRGDLLGLLDAWQWSAHLISGSATIQAVLFICAGLVGLSLLVGYRTRLATVLSWLFLASLHARNVNILQGGDVLLLLLLFWGIFLPLGARFSIDAALTREDTPRANTHFSAATIALLVQAMSVYFFSALLKSHENWIPNGSAVYFALHLETLATPVAHWLREFPTLMQWLTWYVWYLELIGPFLMLAPFLWPRMRLVMQILFITMHIGFALNLYIGLFPYVSVTSLLAFTPGWVWDRVGTWFRTPERTGLAIYYDEGCDFCRKICLILRTLLLLPKPPVESAQGNPEIYRTMQSQDSWVVVDHIGQHHVRWQALALLFQRSPLFAPLGCVMGLKLFKGMGDRVYALVARNRAHLSPVTQRWLAERDAPGEPSFIAQVVVVVFMGTVFAINLKTLDNISFKMPEPFASIQSTARLSQRWNMFAPTPSMVEGWFVASGELSDGTPVDLYRNQIGEPSWKMADYLPLNYETYRWRKFRSRLPRPKYLAYRPLYVRYLCQQWNRGRAKEFDVVRVKLYYNARWPQPHYRPARTERLLLWEQDCDEAPANALRRVQPLLDTGAGEDSSP